MSKKHISPSIKCTQATQKALPNQTSDAYANLAVGITILLEEARHQAAISVNTILTATYWEIGRRIVEFEQCGQNKADYGEEVIEKLSKYLTERFGRGFGRTNLFKMRAFYCEYSQIVQTVSEQFEGITKFDIPAGEVRFLKKYLLKLAQSFPLSWSHYTRLLSVKVLEARKFYEEEAIRGGWSVRQLDRQISTLFYERTALSKNKVAMLKKGAKPKLEDRVSPEEEIKDPVILEFLGLKDEYSESQLEEALILHLESFLLELGNYFTFVGRQKRIRIGNTWYRIDLLFYHRRLRCLFIIDLKVDKFTHADAGQMNLYLNYVWENLTLPDENPPVGLILCSEHDKAAAHYALGNLLNKVMAAEYRLTLPDPKQLEEEIAKTRQILQKLPKTLQKSEKNRKPILKTRQNKFLSSIEENSYITCQEYAEKMGVSAATAQRDLKDLHAKGYVEKSRKNRKIFYKILKAI